MRVPYSDDYYSFSFKITMWEVEVMLFLMGVVAMVSHWEVMFRFH